MSDWFYRIKDVELGPVSESELLLLHAEHRIHRETAIRGAGQRNWTTLGRLLARDAIRKPDKKAIQNNVKVGWPSDKQNDVVQRAAEPTSAGPPAIPLDPYDERLQRKHGTIVAGAGISGMLLLLLLMWLLWPQSTSSSPDGRDSASGFSEQGDGLGDAVSSGSSQASAESGDSLLLDETRMAANANSQGRSSPTGSADNGSETSRLASDDSSKNDAQASGSNDVSSLNPGHGLPSDQEEKSDGALQSKLDPSEGEIPNARFAVTAPGEATFFGIRSSGRRFVFVVDRSGSMDGGRLRRAKHELIACLERLPVSVHFTVIFFDDSLQTYTNLTKQDALARATDTEVDRAKQWLQSVDSGGGTDVEMGMSAALSIRPAADVIFLLTDGQFESTTPAVVKSQNSLKARINTIAFETRDGEPMLMEIAKDNGGDYRFVP
ncbi:MAG: VWA domain-containing protein [Planctomycetaceae bacterium]